jgi:hypothetical protein
VGKSGRGVMAEDKWRESYGCYTRSLIPKVLSIDFNYTSRGQGAEKEYGQEVSCGRRKLQKLFGAPKTAKMASLRFAKVLLLEMEASIKEMEKELEEETKNDT